MLFRGELLSLSTLEVRPRTTSAVRSGVARICIWRGLGARSATGTAGGAGGRAGGGSRGSDPAPGRGFGGITPEKILEI
jgi:hypothetical protein